MKNIQIFGKWVVFGLLMMLLFPLAVGVAETIPVVFRWFVGAYKTILAGWDFYWSLMPKNVFAWKPFVREYLVFAVITIVLWKKLDVFWQKISLFKWNWRKKANKPE